MGFFPARARQSQNRNTNRTNTTTITTTNIQLAFTSPLLQRQQQTSGPK